MPEAELEYWAAKDAYGAAERALAVARHNLTVAECERKREWDRLVWRAENLSPDERKSVAAVQFCGAARK